jgi:uncharacterized repeat protein (TIGR04138 family)
MAEMDFNETVRTICSKDRRYPPEAYVFVREALDYTTKALNKPSENQKKHVTGAELLNGIREFSLQELGPMAITAFKIWGIGKTEDFGEIVFNMVESGLLGKTDTDKRDDFAKGYDFFNNFVKPYTPISVSTGIKNRRKTATPKRRRNKE